MTFLALDYGARRLGLALSDPDGRLSFPLQTHTRRPNDPRGDLTALLDLVRARAVEAVVLGIPGGSAASEALAGEARGFARKLDAAARAVGVELQFFEADERFSTAQAHGELRGAGISTRRSRDSGGASSIDARSAAIFLQTFLDGQRDAQYGASSDAPGDSRREIAGDDQGGTFIAPGDGFSPDAASPWD